MTFSPITAGYTPIRDCHACTDSHDKQHHRASANMTCVQTILTSNVLSSSRACPMARTQLYCRLFTCLAWQYRSGASTECVPSAYLMHCSSLDNVNQAYSGIPHNNCCYCYCYLQCNRSDCSCGASISPVTAQCLAVETYSARHSHVIQYSTP